MRAKTPAARGSTGFGRSRTGGAGGLGESGATAGVEHDGLDRRRVRALLRRCLRGPQPSPARRLRSWARLTPWGRGSRGHEVRHRALGPAPAGGLASRPLPGARRAGPARACRGVHLGRGEPALSLGPVHLLPADPDARPRRRRGPRHDARDGVPAPAAPPSRRDRRAARDARRDHGGALRFRRRPRLSRRRERGDGPESEGACRPPGGGPRGDRAAVERRARHLPPHAPPPAGGAGLEALAEAGAFLDAKYRADRRWEQDKALPAGESFDASFAELARDRFLIGDPARVADEIARYRDRLGVTTLIFRLQWPGMGQEQVLRSIRLLGTKVLPKFS